MPRALDTDAWADEMQIEALRKMGPARRMELAFELSAAAWTMGRSAYDRLYPDESCDKRDARFLTSLYGKELAEKCVASRRHSGNAQLAGKFMTPISPS